MIEKCLHILFLLLFLVLAGSLLFFPALSQPLSAAVLLAGISMAVFFTVRRHWQAHRQGKLSRSQFIRNTAFDLLGLALAMAAAIWLGGLAGRYAAQRVGMGFPALIAGLLAALVVGFAAAWLVQCVWEALTKRVPAS